MTIAQKLADSKKKKEEEEENVEGSAYKGLLPRVAKGAVEAIKATPRVIGEELAGGFETARAFPRGMVKGTKDTAKFAVEAAGAVKSYAPLVGTVPGNFLKDIGEDIGDALGWIDPAYNTDTNYGKMFRVASLKHKNYRDAIAEKRVHETLDKFFAPAEKVFQQRYKTRLSRPVELTGEFFTPLVPVKGIKYASSLSKIGLLNKEITKSSVNIQKALASKYKGKKLQEVQKDALQGKVDVSDRKLTVFEDRPSLGGAGDSVIPPKKTPVGSIDKQLNKIDALKLTKSKMQLEKGYWGKLYGEEGFAAFGAALGVMGVEKFFPENSNWLSAVAAIGGGVFIPPVMGLPKTYMFALFSRVADGLANRAESVGQSGLFFRESAVNHALRANGIFSTSSINKKGLTKEQLIQAKKELLSNSTSEVKEYERIMDAVQNMPEGQEKQDLLTGMAKAYNLYEKVRSKHGEGKADLFVPLVHNVLDLTNLRGLQAALLGQSDINWTFSASEAFAKTMAQRDLADLIRKQENEVTQIRNAIAGLRQSEEGVPELGILIKEIENLASSAIADVNSIKRTPTEVGKNLPSAMTRKSNPVHFEYQKNQAAIKSELTTLTDELGLTSLDIIGKDAKNLPITLKEQVSKENGILQKTVINSALAKARQKADEAYDEAYIDPNTQKDIQVESGSIIEQLKSIAKARKEKVTALSIKPSSGQLITLQNELKLSYLNNLSDGDIRVLIRNIFTKKNDEDSIYDAMVNRYMKDNGYENKELALEKFNEQFPGLSSLRPLSTGKGKIKNRENVNNKILNLILPSDDTQDEVRKYLTRKGLTTQSDTFDELVENFNKGQVSLRDLVRLRGQYLKEAMDSENPFARKDLLEVVDSLQSFLAEYGQKSGNGALKRANQVWSNNVLPLRRKYISEAIAAERRFEGAERPSGKDAQIADEALYEFSENIFMDLLDPTIMEKVTKDVAAGVGRTGVVNTMRSVIENYAVNKQGTLLTKKLDEIKKTVQMSIGRHLDAEFNPKITHSFTNKIDDEYINELDNIVLSTGEQISLLDVKTKSLLQKINNQNRVLETTNKKHIQSSIESALDELKDIVKERGDEGSSLFLNILEVSRRSKDPNALKTMEDIADTIIAQGRIQGKGLRFYGKDPITRTDDEFIKNIEDMLDEKDVERYAGVLRGETGKFQVGVQGGSERRTINYPKEVETGLDKLLYELEELSKLQPKKAAKIENALIDVFIGAYLNKSFKGSSTGATLTDKSIAKINGENISLGDKFTVDPSVARQAYEFYKPFFKKYLTGTNEKKVFTIDSFDPVKETFNKKSVTGKELFEQLEMLVNITPFVTKQIGDARATGGVGRGFSVDTALSFAHSFARQIIGARWILSKKLIEDLRLAQSNTLRKFLTNPTGINLLHDGLIKGIRHPLHRKTVREKLNPFTPVNLSVLYERMIDEKTSLILPEGYTEPSDEFIKDQQNKNNTGKSFYDTQLSESQINQQLQDLGLG